MPFSLYIALRYIRFNLKQSLIIMLAVGMGVGIIIFIPSVNLGFMDYLIKKTVNNAAHIQVTREIETDERNRQLLQAKLPQKTQLVVTDQTLTRRRKITAYNQLAEKLREFPGVTEVAPYIKEQAIIVRGSDSRGIQINGIIPERERNLSDLVQNVTEGNLDTVSSNEVFLGVTLADELGANVGNRVQIVTPWGQKSFKVAGIIDNKNYIRDQQLVVTNLEGAQQMLNMANEVTGIGVRVKDIYQADQIAELIRNTFPVKARSWIEDNVTILSQIKNFRFIIAFVSVMIVMAAASSITSVLIMVVASKTREIGIMKAMGAKPGSITRIFLIQAIILGVFGAMCGMLLALFFINLYNFSPMSRADTIMGIGREPVKMNFEYTIYAILYSMGSSLLASLIPALRAGNMNPVEAING